VLHIKCTNSQKYHELKSRTWYFNAEFDVDSDAAIKHDPGPGVD
jgi:hypothetical protein